MLLHTTAQLCIIITELLAKFVGGTNQLAAPLDLRSQLHFSFQNVIQIIGAGTCMRNILTWPMVAVLIYDTTKTYYESNVLTMPISITPATIAEPEY